MVNMPRAAVQETRRRLENAGLESAQFESRILVETVLELPYGAPLPEQPLTETQQQRLAELTARRCDHEPLQYLCGTWEFFGLEFRVGEGVLIPRQDTETLVETVLELRKGAPSTCLLDLCSGSGCIPAAVSGASAGCHRGSAGTVAGCPAVSAAESAPPRTPAAMLCRRCAVSAGGAAGTAVSHHHL